MTTTTKTTASRATIRAALKRAGVPLAANKYDASGVVLVDYCDVTGLVPAQNYSGDAESIKDALDDAGIAWHLGNMICVTKPGGAR